MLSIALRHGFKDFSLDVSFDTPPGITALFGRSGAGKTTIVNAVAGLMRPRFGRITAGERVLLDTAAGISLPPHRRRIGYIFQGSRLFPHLTVRQNLRYGAWFAPPDAPREDLDRVVELLGIGHLLGRRPAALSGGERQRVAIGRALLAGPRLLLADEPLAALDTARKAELLPYFERLRDELSVPVLYVSHAASEIARLATSVVALENGRVLAQGKAAEILGDPRVTPAGARAAGAVIEARVVRHHADGLSEIDAGGQRLLLPRLARRPGAAVRVRITAGDVILSLRPPEGLSALNVLPGVVRELRTGTGPGCIVALQTPAGRLLARVTRRSATGLGLTEGQQVYAIIKALAVARDDAGLGAFSAGP